MEDKVAGVVNDEELEVVTGGGNLDKEDRALRVTEKEICCPRCHITNYFRVYNGGIIKCQTQGCGYTTSEVDT